MFTPKKRVPTAQWIEEEFHLPDGEPLAGLYQFYYSPYFLGVAAALDDPRVSEVDLMKASQIGWTFFLIAYIAKRIDTDPCKMMILFAKERDGKNFNDEKWEPATKSNSSLRKNVGITVSRKAGHRWDHKSFPDGFMKLVASNSPGNVKSTSSVGLVVVEEPDDTSENVKGQGDAITMAEERLKRYIGPKKLVVGGTPALKGFSKTENRVNESDARELPITCHDCGDKHVLSWDNVSWLEREDGIEHEVYGKAMPETAYYACPHCGSMWDDYQRQKNIRETVFTAVEDGDPYCGWEPSREFHGKAGFQRLSELYVCLPGTSLADVVIDYLKAEHLANQGDYSDKITFVNQKLGEPYEFSGDSPDTDALKDKALSYDEMTVPQGGMLLTAGVDLQHDRVAIIIRAWGRDEESWCIYWGEIYGNTIDKKDPVWKGLDKILFTPIEHESGAQLTVSAVSLDTSDGTTSDAAYHYVRTRQRRGVMAVKGSSNDYGNREIFSRPRAIDMKGRKNTKADKQGLQVYIVGTHKAKDLIDSRIKLNGGGSGRMHWYEEIRGDYYDQLTGEVKAPHRSMRGKRVWQKKAGQAVEALDCEVYALHASRAIKVHLMGARQWDDLEAKLLQPSLFSQSEVPAIEHTKQPIEKPKSTSLADLARKLNG